jgi:glycosyltransferase involved in cell wall biosynthesis
MKILQLCNKAPFPPIDGSSIAIYNMANGLIANNAELHLLTINTKKHFKDDALVPATFKAKTNYVSVYKNTNTTPVGALLNLFSADSYFVSRFYFNEFATALTEKLKSIEFDIVQLEGLFMAKYISIIRRYSKAKIILRAHNVEFLIWERHLKNDKNPIKKWYIRLQNNRLKHFELEAVRQTDAIVTITDADKNFFSKLFPEIKIFNSPTGVDIHEYHQNNTVEKVNNSLFYFGSMDWLPNQEAVEWFLKECWPKIHKLHPECRFIIAGRNMPERFKQMIDESIIVIENVENKTDFYSTYDIMLVPLLSGSGLRIKIVEGMSYGKAIVSTSIGAEGIPVAKDQDLLIADTAIQFAEAVNMLLKNPVKKTQLEKNAKKFASEQLDNKAITSKLVSFYQELIQL